MLLSHIETLTSLGAREGLFFSEFFRKENYQTKKVRTKGGLIFELVEMGGIEPPCMEI